MNNTPSQTHNITLRPRWMVVDDESDLSELIADVLAGLDCASVENFTSAPDALATFVQRGGFDLVVTDRDMPTLDGLELTRRIRAHAPDVKVILASANTDDLTAGDLQRMGINAVLSKPFSLAKLEATVTAMMNVPVSAESKNNTQDFSAAA